MFGNIKKIHFIGICGTLMGNFAVFLKEAGFEVRGSDKNFYSPMSELLIGNNIFTYQSFADSNLSWMPDLIIIGNSISRGNVEAEFVLNNRLNYFSLPEAIKYFFIKNKKSIVVSGTHGKTTTTSMISDLFNQANQDPSYIIGGIPIGYDSGFKSGISDIVVLEGDEYDTAFFDKRSKFLHYKPYILIINNIEFDHADIFNSLDDILLSFKRVVNIVPENGHIIANFDNDNVIKAIEKSFSEIESFGMSLKCKWQIKNIYDKDKYTYFSIYKNGKADIELKVTQCGNYQLYNYTAAYITAFLNKIPKSEIKEYLLNFKGVKRRFEKRGTINNCMVIEDFAHHPTAIENVIKEVKKEFPNKKLLAVFEPRSNTSRRNIFQKELTNALTFADFVIIGKINRIELLSKEERLDVNMVIKDINSNNKESAIQIDDIDQIAEKIKNILNKDWVCLIMTNGSFDGLFAKLGL